MKMISTSAQNIENTFSNKTVDSA